jgi:hypothetical protein
MENYSTQFIVVAIIITIIIFLIRSLSKNGLAYTFQSLDYVIRSSQTSAVNLISSITPWLAPLAPASLTFHNVNIVLELGEVNAWFVALTVEFLGLSSVHTIFEFWFHNEHSRKTDKVPTFAIVLAGFTLLLYLSVVIVVNVLLDYGEDVAITELIAKAGLTLLTIPAAIIMALRAQHGKILQESQLKDMGLSKSEIAEMYLGNVQKNTNKTFIKDSNNDKTFIKDLQEKYKYPKDLPIHEKDWRKLESELSQEHIDWIQNTDTKIVSEVFNVTNMTVGNWRRNLQNLE